MEMTPYNILVVEDYCSTELEVEKAILIEELRSDIDAPYAFILIFFFIGVFFVVIGRAIWQHYREKRGHAEEEVKLTEIEKNRQESFKN
jgi:hypothetical protein